MAINSAPFWWLTCDHPGCTERAPNPEYVSAWATVEQALDGGYNDDWLITDDGEHYCPRHVEDETIGD